MYHLPMSIAYLQHHTAVPAQVMFHPAMRNCSMRWAWARSGRVGGHTLTEGIAALALDFFRLRVSFGAAAGHSIWRCFVLTALCAMPLVSDQLFTAQNDVLTGALLLALSRCGDIGR